MDSTRVWSSRSAPRRRRAPFRSRLVKNDTVIGIIGKTHGVSSASNPWMTANQTKPNSPRPFKSFARFSSIEACGGAWAPPWEEALGETCGTPPDGCGMAPTPIVETASRVAVGAGLDVSAGAAGVGSEDPGATIRGGAAGAGACLVNSEISDVVCLIGALIGVGVGVALAVGVLTEAATIVVSISNVLVVGRRQVWSSQA